MHKALTLIGISTAFFLSAAAQTQLHIEDCYRKAHDNYPLIKQHDLIQRSATYSLDNASKAYLPQVTLSAKAGYQSDVTKIGLDLSQLGISGLSLPTVDKDQYNAALDVTQTLWDGGVVRAQKQRIRTTAEVDKRDVDVALYALNERINQLFFGILLCQAQLRQNTLLAEDLTRNLNKVKACIKQGIANAADLAAIEVELLRTKQTEAQLLATKQAYTRMLALLTGETIDAQVQLVKPAAPQASAVIANRPELLLYEAKIKDLQAQHHEVTAGLMPKFSLFLTGGYGKPSLNMLEERFKAYYIGGLRLSWSLGNFYSERVKRKKIATGISAVETQRETFLFNTALDAVQKQNTIAQYEAQMRYDDDIIALRHKIRLAAEAKMANGTITGTDLVREINAEQLARQNKIANEMQWLLALYNLKHITNN